MKLFIFLVFFVTQNSFAQQCDVTKCKIEYKKVSREVLSIVGGITTEQDQSRAKDYLDMVKRCPCLQNPELTKFDINGPVKVRDITDYADEIKTTSVQLEQYLTIYHDVAMDKSAGEERKKNADKRRAEAKLNFSKMKSDEVEKKKKWLSEARNRSSWDGEYTWIWYPGFYSWDISKEVRLGGMSGTRNHCETTEKVSKTIPEVSSVDTMLKNGICTIDSYRPDRGTLYLKCKGLRARGYGTSGDIYGFYNSAVQCFNCRDGQCYK
ncbi:hypothetical protein [Bdellovibrio sp.]|uniref:hypothetical protein n=1 Tax=Bdellovibrio sp. TaxID=28201 RepID=UPI00322178AB